MHKVLKGLIINNAQILRSNKICAYQLEIIYQVTIFLIYSCLLENEDKQLLWTLNKSNHLNDIFSRKQDNCSLKFMLKGFLCLKEMCFENK